ncbi:MAG: hypothetical protein M1818_004062 [Claussenomyces sp. TS43310]|nr:MAG: hypothetical protein M1818_004062 [Claussenomyces sp. TS43310]
MKSASTGLLLAAFAAAASAQLIVSGSDYTCTKAGAAYCAGDSLKTNIIVRCDGTVGKAGNCDDNLDGYPPIGDNYSPCWQSSSTSGDAACSKNGVVYGSSGNHDGVFTLSDLVSSAPTSTRSLTTYKPIPTGVNPGGPMSSVISTGTNPGGPISVPSGTSPGGTISGPLPTPSANGTSGVAPTGTGSATATPHGPSSTAPVFPGSASLNRASALLAAGGLFAAYFL